VDALEQAGLSVRPRNVPAQATRVNQLVAKLTVHLPCKQGHGSESILVHLVHNPHVFLQISVTLVGFATVLTRQHAGLLMGPGYMSVQALRMDVLVTVLTRHFSCKQLLGSISAPTALLFLDYFTKQNETAVFVSQKILYCIKR
jgi:hypothetical protein